MIEPQVQFMTALIVRGSMTEGDTGARTRAHGAVHTLVYVCVCVCVCVCVYE